MMQSLKTGKGEAIKERKLAEAALRKWTDELDAPAKKETPTFRQIYEKFIEAKGGKKEKTKKNYRHHFKTVETLAPKIPAMPVDAIRPGHFAPMLGRLESEWRAWSYNALTLFIKQIFDFAMDDEFIEKNPYDRLPTKRKKLENEPARVPTVEQCERIVEDIRGQESAKADASADMAAFLHLAALGEAEAQWLTWSDIDFGEGVMRCKRIKTGSHFNVPIFPHLRQFLADLQGRQGHPAAETKLFKFKTIKQSLYNACRRLQMPAYSPRDFRKARIVDLLRKGITPETLSKWQGHRDNGVLIRRTYSWVVDDGFKQYERAQIALLGT
jgi:integrase